MTIEALVMNPASAVRMELSDGAPFQLQWRGLAPKRSWRPLRLSANGAGGPLFEAAWQALETGNSESLTPAFALPLWRAGFLLTKAECAMLPQGMSRVVERSDAPVALWLTMEMAGPALWRQFSAEFDRLGDIGPVRSPPPDSVAGFARDHWTYLKGVLSSHEAAQAASVWRRLANADLMAAAGTRGCRINNDPLGRALLRRLTPIVEQVVGKQLKQSYSFAMAYRPGAKLEAHLDRPQCEYTASLLLDFQPAMEDGCAPWPLEVELTAGAPAARLFQAPGDAVLFRGRKLRHSRPPLPAGACCLVLMLHWVDADFSDGEMDLT